MRVAAPIGDARGTAVRACAPADTGPDYRFNSTLVRLEEYGPSTVWYFGAGFNSTLVRLEGAN